MKQQPYLFRWILAALIIMSVTALFAVGVIVVGKLWVRWKAGDRP